jgi:hypothetical protein
LYSAGPGQLRFLADKIFDNENKLYTVISRFEATLAWLHQNKAASEGQIIAAQYNHNLDTMVKKNPQLFAGLKTQPIREGFTKFLVEEVNCTVDQAVTGPKALLFLEKQWVAYNSSAIFAAARQAVADHTRNQSRRFVVGESGGGGGRGVSEIEQSLLDRMIENSGRIRESGSMLILSGRGGVEVGARTFSWRLTMRNLKDSLVRLVSATAKKVLDTIRKKPAADTPAALVTTDLPTSRLLSANLPISQGEHSSDLPEPGVSYSSGARLPLRAIESRAQKNKARKDYAV